MMQSPLPPAADMPPLWLRAAMCLSGCVQMQQVASLLDHLVGALLEKEGQIDAKRLRRLEIDDQLELRGLLHRHVHRFVALQYFVHKVGAAPKQGGTISAE